MSDRDRAARLKRLEVRKREAETEVKEQKRALNEKERALREKAAELEKTKKQIETLKRQAKGLVISEHAILRYLVRVEGLDLQEVRSKILTDKIKEVYEQLGSDGKFPSGNGFRVVVKGGTIVTVEN